MPDNLEPPVGSILFPDTWRAALTYNPLMVDSPGHTVAGNPLLETKVYIPKWRAGLVSRPRLIERLDQGIERKLTLLPAK